MNRVTLEIIGAVVYLDRDFEMGGPMNALSNRLSAVVEGHETDPRFVNGLWDGKTRFVKYYGDSIGFPIGLLNEAKAHLKELGYETDIVDKRAKVRPVLEDLVYVGDLLSPPKIPRDYQREAVAAVLEEDGPLTGCAILDISVRGGKTLITALLMAALKVRAVFVVPSKGLLTQTVRVFNELLQGASIGQCGDGKWTPGDITVATIQSLTRKPVEALALLGKADLLVIDEAHHLGGSEKWRNIILKSRCRYKVGLTGTPPDLYAEDGEAEESLWLRACTGPVRYRVPMKRLIDAGVLKAPIILMFPIYTIEPAKTVKDTSGARWQETYRRGIIENYGRNDAIAQLTEHAVELDLRVLIDTGRLEHLQNIAASVQAAHVPYNIVWGDTLTPDREAAEQAMVRGETPVIIGTVYGEGIDIPQLEVVVVAEAMKGKRAVIQRLRNLTACDGKGNVLVIDFIDTRSPTLHEHSLIREKVYLSRRGFEVRRVDVAPGEKYRIPDDIVKRLTQHRG